MAVGKEAPVPSVIAVAAACRASLEETVAEFSETFASIPLTTIKRRLKDAVIVMPNGFARAAAADTVIECKIEESPKAEEKL